VADVDARYYIFVAHGSRTAMAIIAHQATGSLTPTVLHTATKRKNGVSHSTLSHFWSEYERRSENLPPVRRWTFWLTLRLVEMLTSPLALRGDGAASGLLPIDASGDVGATRSYQRLAVLEQGVFDAPLAIARAIERTLVIPDFRRIVKWSNLYGYYVKGGWVCGRDLVADLDIITTQRVAYATAHLVGRTPWCSESPSPHPLSIQCARVVAASEDHRRAYAAVPDEVESLIRTQRALVAFERWHAVCIGLGREEEHPPGCPSDDGAIPEKNDRRFAISALDAVRRALDLSPLDDAQRADPALACAALSWPVVAAVTEALCGCRPLPWMADSSGPLQVNEDMVRRVVASRMADDGHAYYVHERWRRLSEIGRMVVLCGDPALFAIPTRIEERLGIDANVVAAQIEARAPFSSGSISYLDIEEDYYMTLRATIRLGIDHMVTLEDLLYPGRLARFLVFVVFYFGTELNHVPP
jgi:hypothetical protein